MQDVLGGEVFVQRSDDSTTAAAEPDSAVLAEPALRAVDIGE